MDRRFLLITAVGFLAAGCDAAKPASGRVDAPAADEPQREVARRPLNPWPEATAVRLFVQKPYKESVETGFIEPDGRLLTSEERGGIEAALMVVSYDREPTEAAACFVPHHFLRYFDAQGRRIGEIAICFCCAGVRTSEDQQDDRTPPGAGWSQLEFTDDLAGRVQALGLPTDVDCH